MMHEPEKSDSVDSSCEADEQSGATGRGAGGAKGRGQGERGPAKHAPGAGPGKRVTGAGTRTASRKAKEEGKVHLAPAPHQHPEMLRTAFYATQARRGARRRRPDVGGPTSRTSIVSIEDLHARVHRGAYRAQPSRRQLHSEGRRQQAPARGRRARRQDRPEGSRRGAERDLRGRLPRVLVWVPAGAQPARCAGCADRRDQQQEGELHTGRRHPIVLR